MNSQEIPAPLLDVFEGLESSPNEAVQRFAGVSRWVRRRRTARTPERIGRELGTAAREEVARVLGQYAHARLNQEPALLGLSNQVVRVGERLRLPSLSAIREDAASLLASTGPTTHKDNTLGDFSAGVDIDRLQALLLSWRLCPISNVAHLAATEYTLRREWPMARRFLNEALELSHSELNRSYAFENLGGIALAKNSPKEAAQQLRTAADCGEDRPTPILSWLVVSLSLGDRTGASEASSRSEEMLTRDQTGGQSCVLYFQALRGRREFVAKINRDTKKIMATMGDRTRRVIDALL